MGTRLGRENYTSEVSTGARLDQGGRGLTVGVLRRKANGIRRFEFNRVMGSIPSFFVIFEVLKVSHG